MRIALVHEFLNQLGGAERVLENFLEIWPDATLYVILYDAKKTHGLFEKYKKRISFLDKFPAADKFPKFFLPLMPRVIESFKFDDFDVVLSDSSSFAKGVLTKGKLHICYCHTPTRFLWTESEDYIKSQPYAKFFKNVATAMIPTLQKWDLKAAARPDFIIANSENVRQRIKKYYQRESTVIPVPVDTHKFYPDGSKKDYFLVASRLEPYKKTALVIEAFNDLGFRLKVVGSGTDLVRLKAGAKSNIEFLGRVSDDGLRQCFSEAKAFIFPVEEDAGIMPLEANACGTPVIAYRAGGALETVKEGITGEFFNEQTIESVMDVVKNFDTTKYSSEELRQHAGQYDKQVLQKRIKDFVEEKYKNRQ